MSAEEDEILEEEDEICDYDCWGCSLYGTCSGSFDMPPYEDEIEEDLKRMLKKLKSKKHP